MKKSLAARWRANFLAGLAVILPAFVSIAIVFWLVGTVADITDRLLFFVPRRYTHTADGAGELYWYWRLLALAVTLLLVSLVGVLARYYFGRKVIEWVDAGLLRVPLLNKVYGTVKQVNEAVATNKKTAFKTVVLVEFPCPGLYSIGFLTSEEHREVQAKTREQVVCVFVPTTPNPTSGFLVLVPENKVTKLEMSVADGIKYIISLGSVAPSYTPAAPPSPLP